MKALSILFAVFACIFFIPIAIGIVGGAFGIVAGVFGGLFGIIAGIFGTLFGIIGGLFNWTFGGEYCDFGFFQPNGFAIAAIIVAIIVVAKSKRGK